MAEDTRTTTAPASAGLLTPASRAIAGLALAVGGLLGQNVISGGLQLALIGDGGMAGPIGYAFGLGFGAAVPALLALALVWRVARADGDGWTSQVSRAAVIVSAVVVAGAALTIIGSLLRS